MFKIHHIANSFISVEAKNSIITCDPWIGKTSDNGWYSYPIKSHKDVDPKIFNSKFIYISHLHCDHLDFKTLKRFKNKNLTFVIKKFDNGILKRRLKNLTNKKIIEIEPFKKKKINKDFTVAIIPQIISNTSNLPDNIGYDLDTSILIQSNHSKKIFYNNVDMPLNLNVLKKINNFVKNNFKRKIDIFCYALGAASEFPQCFLSINKSKEKKRIIDSSLKNLQIYLKYLKPNFFFPAGGKYLIYGKYFRLNKQIAQTSFSQIKDSISNLKIKTLNLIGGGSINFDKSNYVVNEKMYKKDKKFKNKFINQIKNMKYYYSEKKEVIDLKKLDNIFLNAKNNYARILSKKQINTKWNIDFQIYKNFEIDKNLNISKKQSSFLKKYNLKNYDTKNKNIYNLECHIEHGLFKSLLCGKFPWNTSLSGSTIMYKRNPEKFNVDMLFSLNFLRA